MTSFEQFIVLSVLKRSRKMKIQSLEHAHRDLVYGLEETNIQLNNLCVSVSKSNSSCSFSHSNQTNCSMFQVCYFLPVNLSEYNIETEGHKCSLG